MDEDSPKPTGLTGCAAGVIAREGLEQIIQQIQPRLEGVDIREVPLSTGPHAGCSVWLVIVPEGTTAYQATNLKYYKRGQYTSIGMQDYEIDLLKSKRRGPRLVITPSLDKDQLAFPGESRYSDPVGVTFTISNKASELCQYAAITLFIDKRINVKWTGLYEPLGERDIYIRAQDARFATKFHTIRWMPPNFLPIFRGYDQILFGGPIEVRFPIQGTDAVLAWEIIAPEMPDIRRGRVLTFPGLHTGYTRLILDGADGEYEWADPTGHVWL